SDRRMLEDVSPARALSEVGGLRQQFPLPGREPGRWLCLLLVGPWLLLIVLGLFSSLVESPRASAALKGFMVLLGLVGTYLGVPLGVALAFGLAREWRVWWMRRAGAECGLRMRCGLTGQEQARLADLPLFRFAREGRLSVSSWALEGEVAGCAVLIF